MNAREVLMCGGPADGRWVTFEPDVRDWYVYETSHMRVTVGVPVDPEGPLPRKIRYRIQPCMILGHELWVGVAVDEAYDDLAVMKAILQRDVAQHLGAYR